MCFDDIDESLNDHGTKSKRVFELLYELVEDSETAVGQKSEKLQLKHKVTGDKMFQYTQQTNKEKWNIGRMNIFLRMHIEDTMIARHVNTSMRRYVLTIFWPIELSPNLHLSPRMICHSIPGKKIYEIMFLSVWSSWILVCQRCSFLIHTLRNFYIN